MKSASKILHYSACGLIIGFSSAILHVSNAYALDPIPTNTLVLRLKPESLVSLADGAAVTNWPDSSGHGYNGLATNASWQPVCKTNIINGFRIVRFAGTDDRLDTSLPNFAAGSRFTAFAVVGNVSSDNQQPILGTDSAVTYGTTYGRVNGNFRVQSDSDLSYESGQSNLTTAFQFRSFERNSVNHIIPYVNGSADPTGTVTGVFNLSIVGARLGNLARLFFIGDIAEILVYSNQLTAADRQLIEGSLAWKYALQTNLPAGHPYKTTNPNVDAPTLSIADAPAVNEGNSGTTSMVFSVNLTVITSAVVTVQFGTSNGTAIAGVDYLATNGTLTFDSAITTTLQVQVVGDTAFESNKTLYVVLSNASAAVIGAAIGVGTIDDDDDPAVPQDFVGPTANIVLWLRPDLLAPYADGQTIPFWLDASASRNHAVQGTPAKQPVCRTNILNGYSAARFAAGSSNHLNTGLAAFAPGSPFTVFVVVGNVGEKQCVLGHDNVSINGSAYGDLANGYGFRIQDDSDNNDSYLHALTTTPFQVRDFLRNTTNTVWDYVNGSNTHVSTVGKFNGAFHLNIVGGRPSLNPVYLDGDIPEVLIYSNHLNTADRQLVEGCLAWKYGLQDYLPTDHPWKNSSPVPRGGTIIMML